MTPFVKFSNVHNSDGGSNANQSNLLYKKCIEIWLSTDPLLEGLKDPLASSPSVCGGGGVTSMGGCQDVPF